MKRYLLVESGVSNVPSGTPCSIDFDYQKESNDLLYIIKYYKHAKKNQDLFQKKLKQYKITNGIDLGNIIKNAFLKSAVLFGIPIGAGIYAAIKSAIKLINGTGSSLQNFGIAIMGSFLVFVLWKLFMLIFKKQVRNSYEDVMKSEQKHFIAKKFNLETQQFFNKILLLTESQYFTEIEVQQQAENIINKSQESSDKMVKQIEQVPQSFFKKHKKIIFFILLCIGCVLVFVGIRMGYDSYQGYQAAKAAKLNATIAKYDAEEAAEIAKINDSYKRDHDLKLAKIAVKEKEVAHEVAKTTRQLQQTNNPQEKAQLQKRIDNLLNLQVEYRQELQTQAPTYEKLPIHKK